MELTARLVQFQVLDQVGMRTQELADGIQGSGEGAMSEAFAFLGPVFQLAMAKMLAPRLEGPAESTEAAASPAPGADTASPPEDGAADVDAVEGDAPDWSRWGDEEADWLVAEVIGLAAHRADLITDDRIDRLFNSPLAAPIQAWLTRQMLGATP